MTTTSAVLRVDPAPGWVYRLVGDIELGTRGVLQAVLDLAVGGAGEITDWLVGRTRPADSSVRGRGLLVANQMCDLVQMYTSPTGTVTRLRKRR